MKDLYFVTQPVAGLALVFQSLAYARRGS